MIININYIERDINKTELARLNQIFDQHTIDNGALLEKAERFGFVAEDKGRWIGCSSGLAYRNSNAYNPYFFLTDLVVEKEYRGKGIGSNLLNKLEMKISRLGIKYIWTWTAEFEAENFYKKMGYGVMTIQKAYYSNGADRVALVKHILE